MTARRLDTFCFGECTCVIVYVIDGAQKERSSSVRARACALTCACVRGAALSLVATREGSSCPSLLHERV